ncbi:MAG: DUF131 domain-containing protein [Candidatus Nanohaloarchaea archaeon]|nr:DUF131 domain-containing protein [Candidatus Nanohaloarchaea archaeon]
MAADTLVTVGIGVILLGFLLVIAGSLMAGNGETDAEAGGVLFIGPIPVVFGSNRGMAGLSLLLGLVMLGLLWLRAKGL